MNPKFTVVIPVHNRDWELRRALDCLLAQTVNDFECIVVDDSSSIDIPSIVAGYDDRFTCIATNQNSGPSAARIHAFRVMRGEFLVFLDSDNEIFPWALERASQLLGEHGSVGGVSGLYLFPDGFRVRVSGGASLLTPVQYAEGRTSKVDMVGVVRRHIVEEWLTKDPGYYSAEFHLWLTYHMKHTHLLVDEPWGRYNEAVGQRVTTSQDPRKNEDAMRFVQEHEAMIGDTACKPLNEFLSAEWVRLSRSRQDPTFLEGWMKQRGISRRQAISHRISERLSRRAARVTWI